MTGVCAGPRQLDLSNSHVVFAGPASWSGRRHGVVDVCRLSFSGLKAVAGAETEVPTATTVDDSSFSRASQKKTLGTRWTKHGLCWDMAPFLPFLVFPFHVSHVVSLGGGRAQGRMTGMEQDVRCAIARLVGSGPRCCRDGCPFSTATPLDFL